MGRIEYERIENRGLIGRAQMVESDHDVALEDTDRIHGRTALVEQRQGCFISCRGDSVNPGSEGAGQNARRR